MKNKIHLVYGIIIGMVICLCMGFKTGYISPSFKKFFFYDTSNERTANYKDVNEVLVNFQKAESIYSGKYKKKVIYPTLMDWKIVWNENLKRNDYYLLFAEDRMDSSDTRIHYITR